MSKRSVLSRGIGFPREVSTIFLVFTFLRFLLAFFFPVFGDACRYFIMAKAIYVKPSLLTMRGLSYPTPLFLLIAAFFYGIFIPFGEHAADLSLRLMSPLFGSLTVILTYLIAKKLFNEKAAFLSAVFLGFSPSHLLFSSLGYMEGMFIFFVSLALFYIVRHDAEPSDASYGLCGLALGLASLTRQTGLFVVAVLALFTLLFEPRLKSPSKRIKATLLILIGTVLLAGPWYIDQLYQFGTIGYFGQLLPAHEEPVTLDSLLYRVEVHAQRSSIEQTSISSSPWFKLIETYYEFWGVWGGAFDVLLRFRMPLLSPWLLLGGFTATTLFLSSIHMFGMLASKGDNRIGILHLLTASAIILFLGVIVSQLIEDGSIGPSLGYRKPLIVIAPILAIYGGRGVEALSEIIIERKSARVNKQFLAAICISFLLCLVGLCFEGYFMRERYQERLLGGATWLRQNTPKNAVVLTPRALEIAYLAGRRTMAMYLVRADAITQGLMIDHEVSYILIPQSDPTQPSYLDEYTKRIRDLQSKGLLEESYQDSYVLILKVEVRNL